MKGWGAMRVAICDDEKAMHITIENLLIEKVKTETDNTVIACALNGLKNALSERSECILFFSINQ